MSGNEPAKAHNAEPKPEPKPLDGGLATDIAHIASLLGPDDFEPPVAVSPRPVGIREDVKVLAMELFEVAKAETVRPSLKPRALRPEAVLTGGGRQYNFYTRDKIRRVSCGSCSREAPCDRRIPTWVRGRENARATD